MKKPCEANAAYMFSAPGTARESTRSEIEQLRTELDHREPFIAENGAAVFIPQGYFPAQPAATEARPATAAAARETRPIAAIAEANDVQIVPHNPLSPVCLFAELQLDASVANFAIQEYSNVGVGFEDKGTSNEPTTRLADASLVTNVPAFKDGFVEIPTGPGLGTKLAPDAAEKAEHPQHERVGEQQEKLRRHEARHACEQRMTGTRGGWPPSPARGCANPCLGPLPQ